ncbi:hypothetical protein ACFE04_011499 [Oxalis oulophora]
MATNNTMFFYLFLSLSYMLINRPQNSVIAHSHSTSSIQKKSSSPQTLEFLKPLEGFKKGNKSEQIINLRKYLGRFGYLDDLSSSSIQNKNNIVFDKSLDLALKKYQTNFNLEPSGILDAETIKTMSMPRCGYPDYVNGYTRMRAGRLNNQSFDPNYVFLGGKWPAGKVNINYAFSPEFSLDGQADPVGRAFLIWSGVTPFNYALGPATYETADVQISFRRGDHGDGNPFDGPMGVLAHGREYPGSLIHFDADEKWWTSIDYLPPKDSFDLQTVALHEIGHTLGLAHTSVQEAIMFPTTYIGSSKGLANDDIQGVKALYPH